MVRDITEVQYDNVLCNSLRKAIYSQSAMKSVICGARSTLQHVNNILMPMFHCKIQRCFLCKVLRALICAQLEQ
jgi:hypothetical protein